MDSDQLEVTVTGLRPKWIRFFRNRPRGLTEGFCEELKVHVLFQREV